MLRPVRVTEDKNFAHDDGHSRGVFASLRVLPHSALRISYCYGGKRVRYSSSVAAWHR